MNVETLERLETASKEVEAAVDRYLDELNDTIAHEEDDEFQEQQEADAKHDTNKRNLQAWGISF